MSKPTPFWIIVDNTQTCPEDAGWAEEWLRTGLPDDDDSGGVESESQDSNVARCFGPLRPPVWEFLGNRRFFEWSEVSDAPMRNSSRPEDSSLSFLEASVFGTIARNASSLPDSQGRINFAFIGECFVFCRKKRAPASKPPLTLSQVQMQRSCCPWGTRGIRDICSRWRIFLELLP